MEWLLKLLNWLLWLATKVAAGLLKISMNHAAGRAQEDYELYELLLRRSKFRNTVPKIPSKK